MRLAKILRRDIAASGPGRRSRIAVMLFLLVLAAAGALQAAFSRVPGDFLRYHRAGRLVATGNADRIYDREWLRGQKVYAAERAAERAERGRGAERYFEEEFKYLPATAVVMAPLGALHPRHASILWGAWNGFLLGATFAAAWAFASRGASWRWMLVPAVVLWRVAADNVNLGQLNPSAIAPAVVAVWALDRGRDRTAGALAAFGAVMKFLPLALALWFALKRRWTALAVLVGVFMAAAAGLPAVVLGPSRAADLTQEYFGLRTRIYTEAAPDDVPGSSVKSFVYRVFGGVHYQTGAGPKRIDLDISVAHADPQALRITVNLVIVGLAALVAWRAWGPLRRGAGGTDTTGETGASAAGGAGGRAVGGAGDRAGGGAGPGLDSGLRSDADGGAVFTTDRGTDRGAPPAPDDPLAAPEAGLFFCWLLLASPEARAPHFLYLAIPAAALTYALVAWWRAESPDAAGRRRRLAATALAVAAALLVNGESGSRLGRDLAARLDAWCVQGWATAAILAALLLVMRRSAPRAD